MKTIGRALPLLAVTLAFLPSIPARAQGAPKAQNPRPLLDLFVDLDANGDRIIERAEVPEPGRKAFDTVLKYGDTNHDEKLQAEEYRALMQKVNFARIAMPQQREARLKRLDKNGDGKLDAQEFQGGPARFKQFDKNGDGVLERSEIPWLGSPGKPEAKPDSKSEAPPAHAAPSDAKAHPLADRLKLMDKDGDGRVSRDEFTGRPAMFDRLDVNHDGYIDKADRKQAKAERAAK